MTNYYPPPLGGNPLPYSPMNPYGAPVGGVQRACRTAAILQIVLGALLGLFGLCMGLVLAMIRTGRAPAEEMQQLEGQLSEVGVSAEAFILTAIVLVAIPAVLFVVLGIFVWRGSKAGVITSIVLTSLGIVLLGLGTAAAAAEGGAAICVYGLVLVFCCFLLAMLIRAIREINSTPAPGIPGGIPSAQQYYQQYYQQQYQAYQQYLLQQQQTSGGSPENPPPPPMPPSPPVPPSPPSPPTAG